MKISPISTRITEYPGFEEASVRTYVQPRARPEWGSLVRAHRAGAGLTREELCQRSGISNSMLAKIEQGDRTPSPQLLLKMAPALGDAFRDAAVRLLVHQYLEEA